MAELASVSHLWDPDYSEEGVDLVYNNEDLHDVLADSILFLSKSLEFTDTFWDLLLQREVVDEVVQHQIMAKRTKQLQAMALVSHVLEAEVYKFHGFIWALVNSHQSHLAEQLGFDPCYYLDMEVFMMFSSFRCPACHEFYIKAYILTGCGHYVCGPCVKGAEFKCKKNKKEDVTCPVPDCCKKTEASPSVGNIGLDEDKVFTNLGEAVVKRITEIIEPEVQTVEDKKSDGTHEKIIQEHIGKLEGNISTLQKYRNVLRKNKAGIKGYIQEEVRKVQQNVDEWTEWNLGRYLHVCKQVEKKLQKSCQWQKAASELSVLSRARPGFLEGCLKGKVYLLQEDVTDAAKKLVTKLEAGCCLSLLCTPSPYKPHTSLPPAEAKYFKHWKLPETCYCHKLAWLSDCLMVLTSEGLWRMDLTSNTSNFERLPTQGNKDGFDMSVAANGTWILNPSNAGVLEIHYPSLEVVKLWRPESETSPWSVFINNNDIFLGFNSKIIRYSRLLMYEDQYDSVCGDNYDYIHVTERGKLITNSPTGNRIYITDLETKKTSSFGSNGEGDGELSYPTGMCTVNDDDYILVCDYGNNHVSVFTHDGQFIHHLDLELKLRAPTSVAVRPREGRPTLMAVAGYINNKPFVGVYTLE